MANFETVEVKTDLLILVGDFRHVVLPQRQLTGPRKTA